MFLSDLEQVTEIDNTITELHRKLEGLYSQRSRIFDGSLITKLPDRQAQSTNSNSDSQNDVVVRTERQRYDELAESWKTVGVIVPTFSKLKKKLSAADTLLKTCNQAQPKSVFRIVLIPPSGIYKTADVSKPLKFSPAITSQKTKPREWKMYVVATNPEGVEIKDPQHFIKEGGMAVGDVFMSGLNTYEYSVLLSMPEQPVDVESWSILVRDVDAKLSLVPCVSYQSGIYSFEVDSTDVLIGKNHFRPAIEVN